ncbi:macrophage colony-stimulating factor 1 isoform B [Patagioenas fasciata monilis]|uniref:Macrophage colony-stimulating factor 1 isoform B n=1 Tax=Patagioenas fasciata monilis TaxID=372326 RepID=A0A1V4KXG4_PATFA|nr:macrophage colony-stimulating factor 1 isoform B [Patagioenas fasciata monilis]
MSSDEVFDGCVTGGRGKAASRCSGQDPDTRGPGTQATASPDLQKEDSQADTQMQHPGRVSFKFIDKMQLNDSVCYVKAAFPLLGKILERTEFKENSSNAKKMQMVRRMYNRIDENVDPCIREEDDEERKLSQMCFEEFTTSPYEMLVLVKQFFQDINQLLQNQETFEKDCSQVYRRSCPGPGAGASPGVGTDPDCNCLSPALPSATQPSLPAATHASGEVTPASTRVPYSLHATLADLDALSQPPSSTDGGSGTGEVPSAGSSAGRSRWPGRAAGSPWFTSRWPAWWPSCWPWEGCSSTSINPGFCSGRWRTGAATPRSRSGGRCGEQRGVQSWRLRTSEGPRRDVKLLGGDGSGCSSLWDGGSAHAGPPAVLP